MRKLVVVLLVLGLISPAPALADSDVFSTSPSPLASSLDSLSSMEGTSPGLDVVVPFDGMDALQSMASTIDMAGAEALGGMGLALMPLTASVTSDYANVVQMFQEGELARQAMEAQMAARREAERRAQAAARAQSGQLGSDVPFADLFNAAGARHNVDPRMLAAVARAESSFRNEIINCSQPSSAGALGLMQFMPGTARSYGIDPCDPAQAIDGAARMLRGLWERYNNWDLAFAAYNAGPGNVDRYGGIPPFAETRNYVVKVNAYWQEYKERYPEGQLNPGGLVWPAEGPVTSGFGMRWGAMHQGIDIGARMGAPIFAAMAGTVSFAGWQGGYGNIVIINHPGGLSTYYAHQSSMAVGAGASVGQGEVIGFIGSTGDSTGPHLHFEVRENGVAKDPMQWLTRR